MKLSSPLSLHTTRLNPMCRPSGVKHNTLLAEILDGCEWLVSRCGRLNPRKETSVDNGSVAEFVSELVWSP
jgi:hypothetical protein